jgi:hypothetical protein
MNYKIVEKLEAVRAMLESSSPESLIYTDIADEVDSLRKALTKKLDWIDKHGDEYKKRLHKNQRRAHLEFERAAGSALHGLEILWRALERIEDTVG